MRWKRDKHQEFGTTLIETYSWERMNQTLLPYLEEKTSEAWWSLFTGWIHRQLVV